MTDSSPCSNEIAVAGQKKAMAQTVISQHRFEFALRLGGAVVKGIETLESGVAVEQAVESTVDAGESVSQEDSVLSARPEQAVFPAKFTWFSMLESRITP